MRRLLLTQNQTVDDAVDGLVRLYARDSPVCVEFQFRRQLGSEISRCNVGAKNMNQVLPLAVGAGRSVEPA